MMRANLEPRECRRPACHRMFTPRTSMQSLCSPRCAIAEAKAKERAERANFRARKVAAMTRKQWLVAAQREFNKYIRLRDVGGGFGCIDCSKPFEPSKPGGSVDAGHYISRGAAPELRFDPDNVFAQRKNCNKPGGTTREAFRAGVLARIGPDRLAAVEGPHAPKKWTIPALQEIRDHYRAEWRRLEKEQSE